MKIDIDPQTAERLKALEAINGTPPEELITQIVSTSVTKDARYWKEYEEDKATLEAMQNGEFITHEDMMIKLDRLAEEARELVAKDE